MSIKEARMIAVGGGSVVVVFSKLIGMNNGSAVGLLIAWGTLVWMYYDITKEGL